MSSYVLSINPCAANLGTHDPSAVLMSDGEVVLGVEEERFTRKKHAIKTFPRQAIEACLDAADIELGEVETVVVPWQPNAFPKLLPSVLKRVWTGDDSIPAKAKQTGWRSKMELKPAVLGKRTVERELVQITDTAPTITYRNHHESHAASAFHPSGFDEALVVTLDGRGETDATVVWKADGSGLERLRTYSYPNSLGFFFGSLTEFLGFHANNGEGKVMGLAPYGERNPEIESTLRQHIQTGADYDLTEITAGGFELGTQRLEELFDRSRKSSTDTFSKWEKDLAFTAQSLLEEIVVELVETYCTRTGSENVSLAGGVALNCKMNKQVMELDCVDQLFIQPVSNDAGSALGGAMLEFEPTDVPAMDNVYWGPSFDTDEIEHRLATNKITTSKPDDLERYVAAAIANGSLVGWFQGRLEMGPRALGNRSILADPRTRESLDRVNNYVKHREAWRPFAPSMLEDATETYLENGEPSPYMIKTFDSVPDRRGEITAVLHPADKTTRPQTVREEQNPRYYRLIEEFENITGVPVLLNTSFNDHGEPIVTRPDEAVRDFFGMGLDLLVLEDLVIEKPAVSEDRAPTQSVQTPEGED
ncbi:carbamoyltransferase [Halomicroarcula sp. GCM10025817]|uniref:carbamoyltransferase family protein n=1 Tax=Haloarcula TaxID=2237 RepID=UPI0023E79897|nr:carbamoyltransferase C-terminal domain-containing protein [Halomicroarcula sp. SYNS111]